ncbi:hypothetical protein D3C86_2156780 [compost metagenome]
MGHRNAGHLAEERHRTRGARVDLDDIYFILIDNKLDIYQPDGFQFFGNLDRDIRNLLLQSFIQILRRIYGD